MQQYDCDGLAKTLFDILKLVVDMKMWSHLLSIVLFLVFHFHSRWLKRLSTLMSLLSLLVEASQFPFVHQEFYIFLCWDMVPKIEKDENLTTSTKLLKSCSLKNHLIQFIGLVWYDFFQKYPLIFFSFFLLLCYSPML